MTERSAANPSTRISDPSGLARVRSRLLHLEDVSAAVNTVAQFLNTNVGPTEVVLTETMPDVDGKAAHRMTPETAPSSLRTWMLARGHRDVVVVPIRSATRCLALVAVKTDDDEALVRELGADLNRSIELRSALDEKAALAKTLSEKEGLHQQTTDALFRDVVKVLSSLERREAAMKEEMHRALCFQRAMITPLPGHESLTLDALYLPAELISADFYDVAILRPNQVRIFVADATGHGIAAGLATMFIKAEYEAKKRVCDTPSALIAAMNDGLTSRYETLDLRCTAICLDIDPIRRTLRFASAAHPGPAVVRSSTTELFPGGNTFIGLQAGSAFTTVETTLEPGDLVVAYTDGLFDACAADGAAFGRKNFEPIAREARGQPDLFGALVVSGLSSFVGENRTLLDDVTAVAISLRAKDAT